MMGGLAVGEFLGNCNFKGILYLYHMENFNYTYK